MGIMMSRRRVAVSSVKEAAKKAIREEQPTTAAAEVKPQAKPKGK